MNNKRGRKASLKNKIKRQYDFIVIVGLMALSVGLSTAYVQSVLMNSDSNDSDSEQPQQVLASKNGNTKLSDLMAQTIEACNYDLFGQNDTLGNADVCNKIMMFNKALCEQTQLEACKSVLLNKYLDAMGE